MAKKTSKLELTKKDKEDLSKGFRRVSNTIHKELKKNSKFAVLLYLQKNGEDSPYGIAKALGWSTGKANNAVGALEKTRSVKIKRVVENGRVKKIVRLA